MRREDLWQQARTLAQAIVRRAAPDDELALVAFDRIPRTLLTFEQWRQISPGEREEALAQRINELAPTWAGTHLGSALLRAAELLEAPADAGGNAARNRGL